MMPQQNNGQQFDPMLQISQRALASSGSGIVILDASKASHPILFANAAFCRMTGHAPDDMVGRDFSFLLDQHHDAQEIAAVYSAMNNCNETSLVLRRHHQDGAENWCKLLISPVPDETGRVVYFIGVQTDITKHKRDEERLAYQSTHDALTGLPNRNLLKDRLQQAIAQTDRSDDSVALLFLDLDHFKLINDSLGHAAGDRMLLSVAERLHACVREGDTVSRHGGDEFILVLSGIEKSHHVVTICEKIFQTIANPFLIQGHNLNITCSIGIALYPQDGQDTTTLFKYADMALYQAKDQGRNHYQFFSSEMNERMLERVTLDEALRSAIANDELFVHYQPLLDLGTGELVGLETLVRWQHPKFGMVSPVRFIPVAEESSLIANIGEWVLRKACQDMRTWLDHGLTGFQVAVNISPRQFRDIRLADRIEQILSEHRIDPGMLSLEITETVLMQDSASSEATLLQLKRLGIDLALDDFGTGYSSLSYLKRFPFDRVKIDRAFVKDITTDADDAAISRAIISMAHSLGIRVVAEGVETEAQCQFLRRHECDEMQGYYFSRPLPPMEITALLREKKHLPEHILKSADHWQFEQEFKDENQRLNLTIKSLNQSLASANLKLERSLTQHQQQGIRDQAQLDILREMLEQISLPVLGLDDNCVIVFLNAEAEALFAPQGATIGQDARELMPALRDAPDGIHADSQLLAYINRLHYRILCQPMGKHSLSGGSLLTLVKQEERA
jgi:diguanylate cyclase (GGDEF)-like protein/PAS domain S-box-containing protein